MQKHTGLILEGGAMRGLFTCGVIDVLLENNIEFDGCIGVSAGAAFGCNFVSRQVGRAVRYNKRYCRNRRYESLWSLLRTGDLYNADFCYRQLPEELDVFDKDTFADNPTEFFVVCTDAETGRAVYHKCERGDREDIQWMRASASMPLVSRPVELDARKLLDGGMSDSIPVKYFEKIGYNRNVVVLTQPEGYKKHKNCFQGVASFLMRNYPEVADAMERRHLMYNETTEYIFNKEKNGELFVICPDMPLGIGKTEKDPRELERVYQLGRSKAEKCLDRLKDYLNRE